VTLRVMEFSQFLLTREDAKKIASIYPRPDSIDFSDVVSISHCFADELFNQFAPAKPTVVNAPAFVERVAAAV
jgi:hypothetical protein